MGSTRFALIHRSGCGAAWLAHLHGVQGVVGSNPAIPTNLKSRQRSRVLAAFLLQVFADAGSPLSAPRVPVFRSFGDPGFGLVFSLIFMDNITVEILGLVVRLLDDSGIGIFLRHGDCRRDFFHVFNRFGR